MPPGCISGPFSMRLSVFFQISWPLKDGRFLKSLQGRGAFKLIDLASATPSVPSLFGKSLFFNVSDHLRPNIENTAKNYMLQLASGLSYDFKTMI
jgi:hypothetical protein